MASLRTTVETVFETAFLPVMNYEKVFSVRARVRALTPLKQFQIIMRGIMRRLTLFLSTQQWSKQNGGWNRLCSGNPGFFKSLGCCNRLLILFKTKRVKYTAIWKKSIKIVEESKPSFFFYISHYVLLTPLPFQFYFSPQFFLLLHNFIIFPPQCFYSLLHNFYFFPSSMFFIPLLHLLISIVFSPPPPPPHFYCFPSTTTTTTTTFLLFSLHHHYHWWYPREA